MNRKKKKDEEEDEDSNSESENENESTSTSRKTREDDEEDDDDDSEETAKKKNNLVVAKFNGTKVNDLKKKKKNIQKYDADGDDSGVDAESSSSSSSSDDESGSESEMTEKMLMMLKLQKQISMGANGEEDGDESSDDDDDSESDDGEKIQVDPDKRNAEEEAGGVNVEQLRKLFRGKKKEKMERHVRDHIIKKLIESGEYFRLRDSTLKTLSKPSDGSLGWESRVRQLCRETIVCGGLDTPPASDGEDDESDDESDAVGQNIPNSVVLHNLSSLQIAAERLAERATDLLPPNLAPSLEKAIQVYASQQGVEDADELMG